MTLSPKHFAAACYSIAAFAMGHRGRVLSPTEIKIAWEHLAKRSGVALDDEVYRRIFNDEMQNAARDLDLVPPWD